MLLVKENDITQKQNGYFYICFPKIDQLYNLENELEKN